jgi:hypothetical protein
MRRRWSQLSSPDDRWTLGTWCLFSGLFLFYGGCLWLVTGCGPGWLRTTGTCFQAVIEPLSPRTSFFSLCIAMIVLAAPIAVTLIPTLATLLWIMQRAKRLQAERDAASNSRGLTAPGAKPQD